MASVHLPLSSPEDCPDVSMAVGTRGCDTCTAAATAAADVDITSPVVVNIAIAPDRCWTTNQHHRE